MDQQTQKLLNKQSKQKFLAYPFTLYNLLQAFNVPPIFTIAVSQIFTHDNRSSQNMTFGVQTYGVKILKSKDNILRILYYSLLCYLFELKQHFLTVAIKNKFVNYVLNSIKTILPTKYQSQYYLRIEKKPFLTTSQIKSCFVKFMHILQKKQKQCKMVIEELNSLPQMDFIFMSIIKSIVNFKTDKNGFVVLCQQELKSLQEKIGFDFKIAKNQIIIQNQFNIKFIDKSLQIEEFVIQKYVEQKMNVQIHNKLIRKDTTESVGQIDQDESTKSSQKCQDHPDPFNAKLVVSQSTDQFQNQGKQLDQLKQYIKVNNTFDDEQQSKFKQVFRKQQKISSIKLNPFSKKQRDSQLNYASSKSKKRNLGLKIERPRLSQFIRQKSSSKSISKLTQYENRCEKISNFRSFWKTKSKLKTEQIQSIDIREPFNFQRQITFGNPLFCLQRQNTFGNSKILMNPFKQKYSNINIFNQITSFASSPRSVKGKQTCKKQGHTSFCFKKVNNTEFLNLNELKGQKQSKSVKGQQNRKHSFQEQFNHCVIKKGQINSKYTAVK